MEHPKPAAISGVEPLATLIITPRERFSMAKRSLESILANTGGAYRLIYVAGGASADVREYLQTACADRGFDLVLRPEFLVPNAARNIGLQRAKTKYVVFIDNDVIVEPKWLDRLLACAEEEEADFVCPLCFEGEIAEGKLHTMGGVLTTEHRDGQIRIRESHHAERINSAIDLQRLNRFPTDYAEFHCALVRREVFDRAGPLDETIVGAAEHVDLALHLRELGCRGIAEPKAVVAYLPLNYTLGDLKNYSLRWSDAWYFPTMRHLTEKWSIADDSPLLHDYRSSFHQLRERCFVRQERSPAVDPAVPLEVVPAQTIVQLLNQMAALNYDVAAREKVRDAYFVAIELFAASFRASGRTFLSHLVGTGSIMAAHGANPAAIAAAVLHASYSHGRFPKITNENPTFMRRWLKRRVGERIEGLVLAYSGLTLESIARYFPGNLEQMPIETANAIMLRMANAVEDRLGGDDRYFDASYWLAKSNAEIIRWLPAFTAVSERLGVSALVSLLEKAIADSGSETHASSLRPPRPLNFRIKGDENELEPLPSRSLAGFFAPPSSDGFFEDDKAGAPQSIDVATISALNGGSVVRSLQGVKIVADKQPWAYSAYVPLQDLIDSTGPGLLEIRLAATRGRVGALILERGSTVNQVAAEQFADQEAGSVTLRFLIPEFQEVGNVVFRGWPGGEAPECDIFAMTVRLIPPSLSQNQVGAANRKGNALA